MSRHAKKLTRAQRERRAEKKARRAEGAVERIAERMVRERWNKIPPAVRHRYQAIANLYERAVATPVVSEVVCESCGFAQPYGSDENHEYPTNENDVVKCFRGPALGLSCDGEYCITIETYEYPLEGLEFP